MIVKKLKPVKTPQCEERLFKDVSGRGEYPQCTSFSRYEIEGKCYCRRHAALVALDLLVGDADAAR